MYWLIERNLYLDLRGTSLTEPSVQVKLEEVYISLHAQHEKTPSAVDRSLLGPELAQLEVSAKLPAEEIEDHWDSLLARGESHLLDFKNSINEVVELAEVIKSHSHVVILVIRVAGKAHCYVI